jgi:hypothetical protein
MSSFKRGTQREPRQNIIARGRKMVARRLKSEDLPARVLHRAAVCSIYRRAMAKVAARHSLELPATLA